MVEDVVKALAPFGLADQILTLDASSATVALAAEALGIEEDQIAKSLTFQDDEGCIMVVLSGRTKVQGGKFKRTFGHTPHMCSPEQALAYTNHAVGGVCPFGCPEKTRIYLDKSLRRHPHVYPACGASNNAIKLDPDTLFKVSGALDWVDVGKPMD